MKRKIIALLLCIVCVFSLCFPAAADDDGYSAIIGDIDKTCPTCGSALHAFWWSTSGAEVEVEISDTGKIKIPAGAGAIAHIDLKCKSCGYEKKETRLLGLDFGAEKPGKLVQAPSGIGRKDLPGYADDNGTPNYNHEGKLLINVPCCGIFAGDAYGVGGVGTSRDWGLNGVWHQDVTELDVNSSKDSSYPSVGGEVNFYIKAPVTGIYYVYSSDFGSSGSVLYVDSSTTGYKKADLKLDRIENRTKNTNKNILTVDNGCLSLFCNAGDDFWVISGNRCYSSFAHFSGKSCIVVVDPASSHISNSNSITINNNTWNGNIYTDNSTNLTYIYPQYTTVNEKNETVTNISNTPIIYNNETKQYYTYDQTTRNYYYITYNSDPAPAPTPTPAPTDKPGGSISTPETGKPGGSSGSSWWDKLLDKIGNAVIDGLLGAVSAVLKLIFKLLSTILGWIIWAVSLVFTLFPFLPPGLGGLLVGGVVVCFVIGIIKFIRG